MKHNLLRLVVSFGVATGLLGLLETASFAGAERIGSNHSEPQR